MLVLHLVGNGVAVVRARERSSYFSIVERVDNVDNDGAEISNNRSSDDPPPMTGTPSTH